MGLRYPEAISQRVLREVRSMKDSVTYQAILREGREEGLEEGQRLGRAAEAREILLRLGERRFGVPGIGVIQTLEALPLERLHALSFRLLDVESWDELLAE
jgi:predicted transposase YdaD